METCQTEDPSQVRLAFRFGYVGSRFAGSQIQAEDRTVEGEFVAACLRAGLFSDRKVARFATAGRTDRGVHARGQVAAFNTPYPERAIEAINWQLPPDIWCTGYALVSPEFNPRRFAVSRTYRYFIHDPLSDPDAMARAASRFVGAHDFTSFCRPSGKDPVRVIQSVSIFGDDGFTCIEVTGESFLWHMVRCMARALMLVGEKEWDETDISRRLVPGNGLRVSPAPADGLVLWEIDCRTGFIPLPLDDRSGEFLRESVRYHALLAHVTRTLSP
jgi:tRNA pseudouridine38-40 synthase